VSRVCYSVLQCVAVYCSVLQCVAFLSLVTLSGNSQFTSPFHKSLSPLERVSSRCVAVCSVCCSVFQCVTVCCSVLQCSVVCCSGLQCVAVCVSQAQSHCSFTSPSFFISRAFSMADKRQFFWR